MRLASLVLGALSILTTASELPAQAPAVKTANWQSRPNSVTVPVQTVGWRARAYRRGWTGPYGYSYSRPYYGYYQPYYGYYRPYYWGGYYRPRYYGYYPGYYYAPGWYAGYGYY